MYTLLSNVYRSFREKEEYFVIILGLDNAGKTTLFERIKATYLGVRPLEPSQIAPTIGVNVGKIDLDNARVNFWDLGGQRELHQLWESYYNEAHGVIFVIDSTDHERVKEWASAFEKVVSSSTVEGVPVLVLANKQDLPEAMHVAEVKEQINRFIANIGARETRVSPCVALRNEGVKEGVEWLWERIRGNKEERPPKYK